MKKIFTITSLLVLSAVLLAGCYKSRGDVGFDESYWLSKERGEVVYSDVYCNYYVVETYNGYTVVRAYGGYKPYEGSIVYGDFSFGGTHDIYNRSEGVVFTGTVADYWLTYFEAQDMIDYYCPMVYGRESQTTSKSGFRTATVDPKGNVKKQQQ